MVKSSYTSLSISFRYNTIQFLENFEFIIEFRYWKPNDIFVMIKRKVLLIYNSTLEIQYIYIYFRIQQVYVSTRNILELVLL